jgi:hypothetical protein
MGFERAGRGLASRLFPRGSPQVLELLRAAWPRAVGPELSRRTELVALQGATLRVRIPDGRWRVVLHRMQREILYRLREAAGELAPRRLGFVEGSIPPAAAQGAPPALRQTSPAACPPAVADEARAISDPEIRERFVQAAARYLARAEHESAEHARAERAQPARVTRERRDA